MESSRKRLCKAVERTTNWSTHMLANTLIDWDNIFYFGVVIANQYAPEGQASTMASNLIAQGAQGRQMNPYSCTPFLY